MGHADAISRIKYLEDLTINVLNTSKPETNELIMSTHENLVHRRSKAVYEKLKE